MARLRGPGGCPWDRQQTHRSLRRYLIEEAYEVVAAIEEGDPSALCEELGDLLFQVVFHARLAEEAGHFDLRAVIATVTAKMVRRHPHVFQGAKVGSAGEVHRRWEEAKRREGKASHRLPPGLPALRAAHRLVEAEGGGEKGREGDPCTRVRNRLAALEKAGPPAGEPGAAPVAREAAARAWGELLLDLVALAHRAGVDLEDALREAVRHRGAEGTDPAVQRG